MLKSQKHIILLSSITSVVLMIAKFVGYYLTQSNEILTDALENNVNVTATSFALYSIHLAAIPKD